MATISSNPEVERAQSGDFLPIEGTETNRITYSNFLAPINQRLNAVEGRGGAIQYNDFGTLTPTQEQLTEYAISQIWPGYTDFVWNETTPSASTFNDSGGVAHTAVEIFNATWVRNTYDGSNHRFELTNTPTTTPAQFEWIDTGIDTVSEATDTIAGVVKLYNARGNQTDGAITPAAAQITPQDIIDALTQPIIDNILDYLGKDLNQPITYAASANPQQVPCSGWMRIVTTQVANAAIVYVGETAATVNSPIYHFSGTTAHTTSGETYLNKGQYFRTEGGSTWSLTFYPCKGANYTP